MSIIKITGSGAYEHTQETNHSLEYLKRELTEHKEKTPLDHPDGSVTKEKLSGEIRDTLELNSSGITNHEVRVRKLEGESHTHTNKETLDTITPEKTAKWDSYEATINKEKNTTSARFDDIEDVLSSKADKSDTYTKEEINVPLRTFSSEAEFARLTAQQNKTDIQTLREDIILTSEHIRNHDTDIRNLGEEKADKADTYTKSEVDDSIETNRLIASQAANDADAASRLAIQNQTAINSISKVLNKNFVKIAEQTVSPDTDGNLPNVIEFVLDEGLTDFYLLATTKITASSPLRLAINNVSMWGNGTVSGLNSTTNTSMFYWNIQYLSFGEDKGGVISAPKQSSTIRSPQGNYYDDYSVYVPPTDILDKKANIDNITKIKLSLLTSGVTFVNGSTFELWGVKKT